MRPTEWNMASSVKTIASATFGIVQVPSSNEFSELSMLVDDELDIFI